MRPLPPAGGVVHQALGQDGLTGLTDFPQGRTHGQRGRGVGQMTFGEGFRRLRRIEPKEMTASPDFTRMSG